MKRFARAANDNTRLRQGYGGQAGHAAREDAGLYLASGMALVQFWQDNASYDCLDDHFNAQQDRYFPQL